MATWAAILVLANFNGALRELALDPLFGAGVAGVASTVLLCLLIVLVARLMIRWIAPRRAAQALGVGVIWVVLTLAFEFLAGHYLFGRSWEELLREYDVASGRLWVFVPIVTLLAPRWAWGRTAAR